MRCNTPAGIQLSAKSVFSTYLSIGFIFAAQFNAAITLVLSSRGAACGSICLASATVA